MSIRANTIALYRFEGNPNDSTANGYNLIFQAPNIGFPTSPTPIPQGSQCAGPFDTQGCFGGGWLTSNQTIQDEIFAKTTSFQRWSIESYGYITSNALAGCMWRINCAPGTNQYDVMSIPDGANPAHLIFRQNAFVTVLSAANVLSPGQWYHIAITFNGTTAKMYLDGALVATGAMTHSDTGIDEFWVGSDTCTHWRGYLDEFRISNVVRESFPTTDPGISGSFNSGGVASIA